MNYRNFLSVALLVGCNANANNESSESAGTTAQTTGGTTQQSTGSTGGDVPTTSGTTGTTASDTEPGGTGSASQTGSETTQDTAVTSLTSTGNITSTTTGESTGESTSDSTGLGTTGGCTPKVGGPGPVVLGSEDDLGMPGAYTVLAKTGITNVPGTVLDGGHVGVSPAAAATITGFPLMLDPSGVFATSPAVADPYRVYAANYTVPTPSLLTTAVLGMQAAYTDAASRIPTDYLDLGGGDIGGLTLEPGIYTWASTVLVPEDVTLEGCEQDVWIFQIANSLDVSTGKSIILAGGARAENVFWQVAGAATIHANAHFEGIILSKTDITLQTQASLHGRALAQTMVVLDKNAVTTPKKGS